MDNSTVSTDPTIALIVPTRSLDDLEQQYYKYQSLPLDQQRRSSDEEMRLYGKDCSTMYSILKHYISDDTIDPNKLKNMSPEEDSDFIISEAFTIDQNSFINYYDKIKQAIDFNAQGPYVVIYPYTEKYPYTLDELNDLYGRFNSLSHDMQGESNSTAVRLFGKDNHYLYHINKILLIDLMNKDPKYNDDAIFKDALPIDDDYLSNASFQIKFGEDTLLPYAKQLDA